MQQQENKNMVYACYVTEMELQYAKIITFTIDSEQMIHIECIEQVCTVDDEILVVVERQKRINEKKTAKLDQKKNVVTIEYWSLFAQVAGILNAVLLL